MIKLSDKLYIHWLTVLLFASAYITRTLGFTAIMYSVMLLHELSHALAAKLLKLGIGRIVLYPFGLCLTVRTRILCSFSDEVILYTSGPAVNAIIAAVMCILGKRNLFFYNNLALFILNLLPIYQLDGGRILMCIIEMRFGQKRAEKIMKVITAATSLSLLGCLYYYKLINVNTVSFIAFLVGNIITQKRKYNRDSIRELAMKDKKKRKLRANVLVADDSILPSKLAQEFSPARHTVVLYCNNNGKINAIKTDREIIDEILK